MTVEQLRRVHQASPFRPFTIHVADGREYRVRHPELLSHSETGRTVIVHLGGDDFEVLDLLLVTGIEVGNGHRRGGGGRTRRRST
jgi:hypothetical protein